MAGRLTPAFLMHALCAGNVDFFAASMVSLSGVADGRVQGILVEGRESSMRALYRESGLAANLVPLFISATLMWRQASRTAKGVEAGHVPSSSSSNMQSRRSVIRPWGDLCGWWRICTSLGSAQANRDYAQQLAGVAA